ncbi:MAG: hypothetical protein RLZZ455_1091 [Candidatus Parcubacteria bacterium]|jgi:CDP-diglyceride synthetase
MRVFAIVLLLFLSVLLEGTFFAAPLVLCLLIVLQILSRSGFVMLAAFFSGLFLDSLLFRPLGQTGLFFLAYLALLAVYERRFEVQTYPFLFGSVTIGTLLYMLFFAWSNVFVQLFIALFYSVTLYVLFFQKDNGHEKRLKFL